MQIKQIILLIISAAIGAALSGYVVWKNAATEHKRLMRIEINNDYINSLDNVSTGKNVNFSRRDFQQPLAECLENSQNLSTINSLPTGTFTIEGWKEYVDHGLIAYSAVKTLGNNSPVYACIFDSDGHLQETRLVLPLPSPDQNLVRAIKESSFLEVDF